MRHWKVVAAIVAVMAGLAGVGLWARTRAASKNVPAFRFEATKADRGPIRAKVTATGTVNPYRHGPGRRSGLGDHPVPGS